MKIEKIKIGEDTYEFRKIDGVVYAPFGSWQFPLSNEVFPNDKEFDKTVDVYVDEFSFRNLNDKELIEKY